MSTSLIEAFPKFRKPLIKNEPFLDISEFYSDTIQGEGANIGVSATFLRLQSCSLHCHWCDTAEVWTYGNPYTFNELFDIMEAHNVIKSLQLGQHLILTGGSPLLQQKNLILFLTEMQEKYDFLPYIEVENECVIWPDLEFCNFISCWNNSPKLANSGNIFAVRYQPKIIEKVADEPKFMV
jgi:organic radical activating enzyme